tara:strand:+ start:4029 stop:4451 length:423 start_codon:yes stop_codon:yes gene_type:complete
MNLIKTQKFPFNSLLNGLFDNDIYGFPALEHSVNSLPKVNLLEDDNGFQIMLAAPGLKKEDFNVDLNNHVLKVSVNKAQSEIKNYIKKEFSYLSFTRSFNIPKSVDLDNVNASYKSGILTIDVPKKEEAKPIPARVIKIK